eukprot:s3679_g5.t1
MRSDRCRVPEGTKELKGWSTTFESTCRGHLSPQVVDDLVSDHCANPHQITYLLTKKHGVLAARHGHLQLNFAENSAVFMDKDPSPHSQRTEYLEPPHVEQTF